MNILAVEIAIPTVENVEVTGNSLIVELNDGRTLSAPLAWFPRLLNATQKERKDWRLIGKGYGIHWKKIDEDISVENLLVGKPSGESQTSLRRWLDQRTSRLAGRSSGPSLRARR